MRGGAFSLEDTVAWIYVSKMHFQRITAFNWCEVSVLQQQGNHPERVSQITSLQVERDFNQVIITTDDYKDIYIWKLQVGDRSSVTVPEATFNIPIIIFEVQFSASFRILWERDLNLLLPDTISFSGSVLYLSGVQIISSKTLLDSFFANSSHPRNWRTYSY